MQQFAAQALRAMPRILPIAALCLGSVLRASADPTSLAVGDFRKKVQPVLAEYCYDCHADGANKGGIAFDELKSDEKILDHDLWLKVLKNVRAGLMPPQKKPRPST